MKKTLTLLLIVTMMITAFAVPASAAEDVGQTDDYMQIENGGIETPSSSRASTVNTGLVDEVSETEAEQLAALNRRGLSDTDKSVIYEKLTQVGTDEPITPKAVTWKYLSGFQIWKQSQSYYCVPASCKAAVQYLTGSSDSQATVASAMGTTTSGTPFSAAKTYLNGKQSSNTYVTKNYDTALSTVQSNFYSAIHTWDAPPLISVKLTTASGWPYSTTGHTMLITGARSDKEEFRIADPYIQWVDSSASMYYSKTASAIRTAIYNRGNGYIY